MEKSFAQWKKQCLNKADLSKKGAVDEAIEHVVSLLNSREEYFTTSSCSGRVILIDGVSLTHFYYRGMFMTNSWEKTIAFTFYFCNTSELKSAET